MQDFRGARVAGKDGSFDLTISTRTDLNATKDNLVEGAKEYGDTLEITKDTPTLLEWTMVSLGAKTLNFHMVLKVGTNAVGCSPLEGQTKPAALNAMKDACRTLTAKGQVAEPEPAVQAAVTPAPPRPEQTPARATPATPERREPKWVPPPDEDDDDAAAPAPKRPTAKKKDRRPATTEDLPPEDARGEAGFGLGTLLGASAGAGIGGTCFGCVLGVGGCCGSCLASFVLAEIVVAASK
jgi:hypothetical protein